MSVPRYQTVKWWIEQFKEMPNQDAVVHVATGFFRKDMSMLSLYESEDKSVVYLDVGDGDDEA